MGSSTTAVDRLALANAPDERGLALGAAVVLARQDDRSLRGGEALALSRLEPKGQ
jgi:hypothetical protein